MEKVLCGATRTEEPTRQREATMTNKQEMERINKGGKNGLVKAG